MKSAPLQTSSPILQTFFQKFDQFADAPNAVAKMRELLIHFAVSGKLVTNDLAEKPIGLKLSGAPTDNPGIPVNWRSGLLGEVFAFEYGDNLPAPKRTETGEYPVYGSNGIVGTHDTYLTKESAIIVGRKGSAGALNIADGPSWTTDVAYFVRPPKDLDLRFTYYLFSTLRLDELGKGIKPGLSRKEAYALPIAIPPLPEQKRIVAKVDELMALCDRLEAQQEERKSRHAGIARAALARFADAPTPSNLNLLFHPSFTISPADLRKSILTLAVQGKLVPQDPKDEPAETILRTTRSLIERLVVAKKLSSPKPLPPIEESEIPFSLPNGWAWCRLGQVMRISSGDGLIAKDMCDGPIPVYGGNGVNGHHDAHNVAKRTLVIGRVGFYCGSIHVTPESAWVTDNAFITTFDEEHVDMDFLSWLLKATDLRERDNATAQPVISGGKVYPTILALPPLAEQRRIVAKVDQLMALVDQLETQLAASRATAANLLEAFVAELTVS